MDMTRISWKWAYGVSLVFHLVILGYVAFVLSGVVTERQQEQFYVVDLDTSDLYDSGSGHSGGSGGSSNLFPEKLSEKDVEQRTAAEKSNSLASVSVSADAVMTRSSSDVAQQTGDASSSGISHGGGVGTGSGSGEGSGIGSGSGSGAGSGSGDGIGDGYGYGDGSGNGQGSGDSGAQGTGSAPFDTDGFWAAVNANKVYPAMAIKRGLTGTVYVDVTLDGNGNCLGASASDDSILAKAAVNAVYAACPYPNATNETITIQVPITFDLT